MVKLAGRLKLWFDRHFAVFVSMDTPYSAHDSAVIPPDTQLDAITPKGKLSVRAGHGMLRTISWDGATRQIEVRSVNGRAGQLLWFSRGGWPGYDWAQHNGVTRCRYCERQQNFETTDDFVEWMKQTQNTTLPYIYTDHGLMVGWTTDSNLDELTIEIYKITIAGQPPSKLPGSDDRAIVLSGPP